MPRSSDSAWLGLGLGLGSGLGLGLGVGVGVGVRARFRQQRQRLLARAAHLFVRELVRCTCPGRKDVTGYHARRRLRATPFPRDVKQGSASAASTVDCSSGLPTKGVAA